MPTLAAATKIADPIKRARAANKIAVAEAARVDTLGDFRDAWVYLATDWFGKTYDWTLEVQKRTGISNNLWYRIKRRRAETNYAEEQPPGFKPKWFLPEPSNEQIPRQADGKPDADAMYGIIADIHKRVLAAKKLQGEAIKVRFDALCELFPHDPFNKTIAAQVGMDYQMVGKARAKWQKLQAA